MFLPQDDALAVGSPEYFKYVMKYAYAMVAKITTLDLLTGFPLMLNGIYAVNVTLEEST